MIRAEALAAGRYKRDPDLRGCTRRYCGNPHSLKNYNSASGSCWLAPPHWLRY